ncbi:MAG: TIGR03086 family metal-binding protein [Propionibacteriaceae bacterium]|nr:TIGR03086 family metal-binding protein [Propionibacteriaceae bacterium]
MTNEFSEAHRLASVTFTERIQGVTDWDAPAPVDGWTARSVVEHLLAWFPGMLAAGSDLTLPPGPDPATDLVGAWEHQRDAVQAILEDPATATKTYSSPATGDLSLPVMINNFYTADVFMHTWDLARATGQDDRLDEATASAMFAGMEPIEEMLRASGQFGTQRGPLRPDADATDKLMSFVGRDPYWTPPAGTSA